MIWLYIAAAIFGGTFVLASMAGGLELDADIDLDFDTDLDFDPGVDLDGGLDGGFDTAVDADVAGAASAAGDFFGSLLTFRSLTFFSAFFGLAGLVFSFFNYIEPIPLVTGAGLGLVAAVLSARLFAWMQKNQASSQISNRDLHGARASVTVPLGLDRKGRIKVELEGETTFMVALPHSSKQERFDVGENVVVVEIENGTALVAPLPGLGLGQE